MPHPLEHTPATSPLGRAEAEVLAESLRAFGAASRLRLMAALLAGERTVENLARAGELTPSAASQQLRVLRQLRLVAVRREGRRSYYRLHDSHVADLLVAIRHHYEHLEAASWPPARPEARTERDQSGG